jgi:hypothetical protein
MLTPLELLDRLARFIPPPRRHLHRYPMPDYENQRQDLSW